MIRMYFDVAIALFAAEADEKKTDLTFTEWLFVNEIDVFE